MCVECGATGPERNADATERKFVRDWNTRNGAPVYTSPLATEGRSASEGVLLVRRCLYQRPAHLIPLI